MINILQIWRKAGIKQTKNLVPVKTGIKELFSSLFFNFAILFFIIGLGFTDTPTPFGWYQQFMPNMGNKQIADITFLDSLNGIAVAHNYPTDSNYVLRTSNGGDNWLIIYRQWFPMQHIQFLNNNTGYACAGYLYKTTDGGFNWSNVNTSGISGSNMYILNQDTIWLIDPTTGIGGVFRTTNGGVSWVQQASFGSLNPDHIYMFNSRIGFIGRYGSGGNIRKTTDGGQNWFVVQTGGFNGFTDMHFVDNVTGWKCGTEIDSIKKTTDGGLTWFKQLLPPTGGFYSVSQISKFTIVNIDTLWGVGARCNTSLGFRGLIYRTTNSGETWGYQLPDSNTINIGTYNFVSFINKINGWAYSGSPGVHTVTGGGDTTIYTQIQHISSKIPNKFVLGQNYPNPFNPTTSFKIQIIKLSDIKIIVYDITGRMVFELVNKKLDSGEYKIDFDGSAYSSGVYFYSLYADGILVDTKKMILIK